MPKVRKLDPSEAARLAAQMPPERPPMDLEGAPETCPVCGRLSRSKQDWERHRAGGGHAWDIRRWFSRQETA